MKTFPIGFHQLKTSPVALHTDSALAELRALSNLINPSIDASRGEKFPSPYEPVSKETEAPRMAPDVRSAYSNVVAAAAQLIASIRPPASTIVITAIQVGGLRLLAVFPRQL